jgi:hypothetical protein
VLVTPLAGCSYADTSPTVSPSSLQDPVPYGALPTDAVLHPVYDDSDVEEFDRRSRLRQAFLHECLMTRGFDQIPLRDFGFYVFETPIDRNADWSEQRKFVSQHGFGITDGAVSQIPPAQDAPNFDNDADAAAYNTALDECEMTWTPPKDSNLPGEDIDRSVLETAQAISTDVDWASADALWAPCMRQRGFDYPTIETLWDDIGARLEAAMAAPDSQDARTEVAAFEIDTAKASLECQITEVIRAQRVVEIRLNLEKGLIETPPG